MEKEAYSKFKKHITQWVEFLSKSVDYLNQDDEDEENKGEITKKDRQLGILTNILTG